MSRAVPTSSDAPTDHALTQPSGRQSGGRADLPGHVALVREAGDVGDFGEWAFGFGDQADCMLDAYAPDVCTGSETIVPAECASEMIRVNVRLSRQFGQARRVGELLVQGVSCADEPSRRSALRAPAVAGPDGASEHLEQEPLDDKPAHGIGLDEFRMRMWNSRPSTLSQKLPSST